MKEKFTNFVEKHPRAKKFVGVLSLLIGIVSVLTPFTPLGFMVLVGLELLGIRELVWEKVKALSKHL